MFITLGLRAVQILFSVVVLGLGVTLIKGQEEGAAPSQTVYAAFCGGFGIVAALLGIVSIFAENLSALIFVALDGLAALFAVAGGIALAVALGANSCSDLFYLVKNPIIKAWAKEGWSSGTQDLPSRCRQAQGLEGCLFVAFAAFMITAIWFLFRTRKGHVSAV